MFPFVIPWDDSSHGVITDVSFLNDGPAGSHGNIVARDGHFVEAKTGRRVRFLATNFVAKSAFPSHEDAVKVAKRIAKLGINLVRLHHMDNSDWGQQASIWDYGYKDRRHISAAQLDRLDYLIAQFKKNGVYVNINLHVSRQFSEADGFPASVAQIPFGFDKRVDEFDRTMIARQKEYARDLLTHVNPYTKLAYNQDPAVAVVEINNENSLVGDPWATLGGDLDTLPEPFRGELAEFWNAWLLKKYGTDAQLSAAWLAGVTAAGPELLTLNSTWSSEAQGTSQAEFTPTIPMIHGQLPQFAPYLRAEVKAVDGVDWHVQAHVTGLNLRDGDTYTVSFRAKADTARVMPVATSLDQADWRNVGLSANAALTPDWKDYQYVFTVHDAVPNHVRVAFTLGGQTGVVWIEGLKIHAGADGSGLHAGESLAAKSIPIPLSSFKAQHDDWVAFLADTESAYANEMRAFLKNDLKVKANIICSQMGWGGVTSVGREAKMDFADNHAYWQHPSFPHKPWDSVDWNIGNTPMVADLAGGGGGTLRNLAEYRVAGKPYSISEYNHPAPSDYRAEMMPELATFAAFQDWDMIYLFDYGDYGEGVQNDKINSFFGIGSDPAKAAFLPAAAMIFRGGAFASATAASVLPIRAKYAHEASIDQVWRDSQGKPNLFQKRISIQAPRSTSPQPSVDPSRQAGKADPISKGARRSTVSLYSSNHSESPQSAVYTAQSPQIQAFAGYVGHRSVGFGTLTLVCPSFGNNFASGVLAAMDGKPILQSRRMLLTLAGKVENQDMVWSADRTSVGNQWGHGPTIAEGIPATVTIKIASARRVWALDGTGKRAAPVPATYKKGELTFTAGPQYQTLWYEIGE
ncbi:hypothetical protein CCAX7_56750 [Capsulimonas corticalis]|uniref:CBM-cenC domain-containing protein n=2 Tax=Capsulimonas corticalis TaxID=2219043 RepID=A0A9N7QCP0_9BACT|nr:hypothetical protein CCAX7_56750 [Capsulimonas corticalis]